MTHAHNITYFLNSLYRYSLVLSFRNAHLCKQTIIYVLGMIMRLCALSDDITLVRESMHKFDTRIYFKVFEKYHAIIDAL